MGIVGNLRTMQLEELLQWLSQSKKSGTLEINSGKVEKRIYFKDGRILSSSSSKPEEYLGHFLVSHGLISEMELAKAIELQEKTRTLLGKILVTTGALRENDLHRMLRFKAEESIYDIFAWTEADFRFLDDVLPESAMVPMSLDVTAIVMEGVQRVDEWRRIRQLIPTSEAIPVSVGELEFDHARPGERRILELIDDNRTVEEIRVQTHSSEFHVARVLFEQQGDIWYPLFEPVPDAGPGAVPQPRDVTAAVRPPVSVAKFEERVALTGVGSSQIARRLMVDPLALAAAACLRAVAGEMPVIFPVHPRTRGRLTAEDPTLASAPGLAMLEPIGYLEFLSLVAGASGVLTDSGGIQEETTFLGIPCLTLRDNTERPITESMGTNLLLGLAPERIRDAPELLALVRKRPCQVPPLWDGCAAERIVDIFSGLEKRG